MKFYIILPFILATTYGTNLTRSGRRFTPLPQYHRFKNGTASFVPSSKFNLKRLSNRKEIDRNDDEDAEYSNTMEYIPAKYSSRIYSNLCSILIISIFFSRSQMIGTPD